MKTKGWFYKNKKAVYVLITVILLLVLSLTAYGTWKFMNRGKESENQTDNQNNNGKLEIDPFFGSTFCFIYAIIAFSK